MTTRLLRASAVTVGVDAMILPAFEDGPPKLGQSCDTVLADLYNTGEFRGKALELALLHRPTGIEARRLLLVGLGKRESATEADFRKAAGAAVRHLQCKSIRDAALWLDRDLHHPGTIAAAVEGALLGQWEPDQLKTDPEKAAKRLDHFSLVATDGAAEVDSAFERGLALAECQNFTRDLVNEPANRLNPTELSRRAQQMAAAAGLECEVLSRDRMRQLGMGALLGVAQGSAEPPALIVVRYQPGQEGPAGLHLGLVGKGVTFDTGGISIKPADGMEKMKYDMAGGAAVLGAMRAIARLKPAIPVTALIPAVENMPGDKAQRPGDIVTSLNGKTVEVLNTDAEGRLILIDAFTYAQRLGCTHLVNAATLTGAIVVALGHVHVGAFTNNQELLDRVLKSARTQGEKMWPMPLDDDYKEQLKSPFADLPNIGTRWGGAITAAYFLKEFADPTPWVHLDIAGTAWLEDAKPFLAKGPTGVCVRTFADLAMNW
jgi:leucyl aminopeptidase